MAKIELKIISLDWHLEAGIRAAISYWTGQLTQALPGNVGFWVSISHPIIEWVIFMLRSYMLLNLLP